MQIKKPSSQGSLMNAADFVGGARQFYIAEVQEKTFSFHGATEEAYVLLFLNEEKELKLNATNRGRLIDMFGDESDDWIHQLITLQREPCQAPDGSATYGVRVVFQQPVAPPTAPPPAPGQPAAWEAMAAPVPPAPVPPASDPAGWAGPLRLGQEKVPF